MYLLSYDARPKFKYAYRDLSFSGYESTICPSCQRAMVVMRYEEPIHKLIVEGGKNYPDLLQFTGAGERMLLLSEHALKVLTEEKITGIGDRIPVVLQNAQANAPQYYCVEVTGTVEVDFAAMHLKKKKHCAHCGQFEWNRQRMDPIVLDEASWDLADLCRIKSMPGFLACSVRFMQVVKENGLTGFAFQ